MSGIHTEIVGEMTQHLAFKTQQLKIEGKSVMGKMNSTWLHIPEWKPIKGKLSCDFKLLALPSSAGHLLRS